MEENKQNLQSGKGDAKPQSAATAIQRQRRKKLLVYPLLFLAFIGVMYLIFAPSKKEQKIKQQGLNTELPMPKEEGIIEDKRDAYEKQELNDKQSERMHSLDEISQMLGGDSKTSDEYNLKTQESNTPIKKTDTEITTIQATGEHRSPYSNIRNSNAACKNINKSLGGFYQTPEKESEKEEHQRKVFELNNHLRETGAENRNSIDDQLILMEKSYQLAAKYLPGSHGNIAPVPTSVSAENTSDNSSSKTRLRLNKKETISSIQQVRENIVSSLPQSKNDYLHPTQCSLAGFHTAVGTETYSSKNTIKACIYSNQTVTSGQDVKLRLIEPMQIGDRLIPSSTLIAGKSKIEGERLTIEITSLEFMGTIIQVQLSVFDNDGQIGIFIPGSLEQNSIKEIAANMGSGAGSSINLTQQSAGSQLLSDLGKGAIQGTSQYIAKKMQETKVHLKAGYQLLLYQDAQQ